MFRIRKDLLPTSNKIKSITETTENNDPPPQQGGLEVKKGIMCEFLGGLAFSFHIPFRGNWLCDISKKKVPGTVVGHTGRFKTMRMFEDALRGTGILCTCTLVKLSSIFPIQLP